MKLHFHNRAGSLGGLQTDIENMFNHMFGHNESTRSECCLVPPTNVAEKENGFDIVMELPGVSADDISIEFSDDQLQVSGEKKVEPIEEGVNLHFDERCGGKFERKFEFPTQVDFEKIEAEFENGLLLIQLPKSERVKPRKISINVK